MITKMHSNYISAIVTKSYKHQIFRINLIESCLKRVSSTFTLPLDIIDQLSKLVNDYNINCNHLSLSCDQLFFIWQTLHFIIEDFFLFHELKISSYYDTVFLGEKCIKTYSLNTYHFTENYFYVKDNIKNTVYKVRNFKLMLWFTINNRFLYNILNALYIKCIK